MRSLNYKNIILLSYLFIFLSCREQLTDNYVTPMEYKQIEYEIISPQFGDNWDIGSLYTIQWTPIYGIDYVKIFLYKKTEFIQVVSERTPNSGKYSWLIPELSYRSHHFILKIINPANNNTVMESANFFILK